jgi:hypothetical protein
MPLRDFFHQPLAVECDWSTFHGTWITTILQRLNRAVLKKPFAARSFVNFGTQVEVDVSTLQRQSSSATFESGNGNTGSVATATRSVVYTPPAPPLSSDVNFVEPDLFEVKIFRGSGAWKLVAAIELVSESNKDREETRRAFAIKCASYLQKSVSIVVVDVVTNRSGEMHNDLCELLDLPVKMQWASPTGLHAAAYRVAKQGEQLRLDVWPVPLSIGEPLPIVPIWVKNFLGVAL